MAVLPLLIRGLVGPRAVWLQAGTHTSVTSFWAEVTDNDQTPHSGQMDVVLALWKNGLVVRKE